MACFFFHYKIVVCYSVAIRLSALQASSVSVNCFFLLILFSFAFVFSKSIEFVCPHFFMRRVLSFSETFWNNTQSVVKVEFFVPKKMKLRFFDSYCPCIFGIYTCFACYWNKILCLSCELHTLSSYCTVFSLKRTLHPPTINQTKKILFIFAIFLTELPSLLNLIFFFSSSSRIVRVSRLSLVYTHGPRFACMLFIKWGIFYFFFSVNRVRTNGSSIYSK